MSLVVNVENALAVKSMVTYGDNKFGYFLAFATCWLWAMNFYPKQRHGGDFDSCEPYRVDRMEDGSYQVQAPPGAIEWDIRGVAQKGKFRTSARLNLPQEDLGMLVSVLPSTDWVLDQFRSSPPDLYHFPVLVDVDDIQLILNGSKLIVKKCLVPTWDDTYMIMYEDLRRASRHYPEMLKLVEDALTTKAWKERHQDVIRILENMWQSQQKVKHEAQGD